MEILLISFLKFLLELLPVAVVLLFLLLSFPAEHFGMGRVALDLLELLFGPEVFLVEKVDLMVESLQPRGVLLLFEVLQQPVHVNSVD